MSAFFDITRIAGIPTALTPEERTRYGLGDIGVDPRNAVAIVQVIAVDVDGVRGLGDPFFYPFERAATTPAGLLATLRPLAEAAAVAAENTNTYRELIGRRFRV